MTDRPMVEAFLVWAEKDRQRSPHTLARYRAVLASLPVDPATATLTDVEGWWSSRTDLAPATRQNELACLRAFYRWAMRFDHRPDDPTRRLDAPKVPNRIPTPVSRAELDILLAAATESEQLDLRRAFALGAYGGLRVSEVAALDWSHIDEEARRLRIRGKGAKERLAGLSPVLLDELLPRVEGNVVTAGGMPYSAAVLQRKINRFIERQGIDKTFHNLRARYATLAIARTGNVHAVSKALGWASIETANAYALVSDESLDQIAAAAV